MKQTFSPLLRAALLGASALSLSACAASIKGRADPPDHITGSGSIYQAQMIAALCDAERAEDAYHNVTRPNDASTVCLADAPPPPARGPDRALHRNDFAYSMMRAYELALQDYARNMAREGRGGALAQTLADVGLTAGAAISTVSKTQSIFGHLATAVSGLGDGYQKQLLIDNTLPVLLANMAAAQLEARTRIIRNLKLPLEDYPLSAVKLDVAALGQANTIEAAISRTAGQAQEKKQAAQAQEDDVRKIQFEESENSARILDWIAEGSTTAEKERRARLLGREIEALKLEVNYADFMSQSSIYGQYYPAIIKKLNIK